MFELNLNRTDFAQVGTTNRNCMKVIPVDKAELRKKGRGLDKIVVGSQNGCVICICRKHNDTQIVYKTLPGAAIEAVCLGGALGSVQDKVFVSSENTVRGISKKGKQFFNFETNMAEHAKKMYIYGVDLVLCGKKSYNHYHDCADANYVLCNEEIHDVVVLAMEGAWGGRAFTAILACNDGTIKVIEGSKVDYEIQLSDIPYTLYLFMGDGGFNRQMVLYGTKGGRIGLLEVPAGGGQIIWEINTTTAAAVTCIICYAMTGNSSPDIILGKEDGLVEIYTVDESDKTNFKQSYQCEESITGIGCGRISNEEVDELIVCTYTGWLFSLSRQAFGATPAPNEKGQLPPTQPIHVKVQQLKNELDELEAKVNEERNRYEELTRKGGKTSAFVPHFQVHDNFTFNSTHCCYILTLELVIPIDYIVIQSEVDMKLLEAEKNTAVISHTEAEEMGWKVLATYRCQANTTRIELRLQVDDGVAGALHVYVCPKIHPKMCQSRTYEVKPLATYTRVHAFDVARPKNTLSFTGSFSLAEAHAWLVQCLPSLPPRPPPQDSVQFNFQSTVNGGTQLQVSYSRGSIIFTSDSMSAIAIVRENISEELTRRQIKAATHCDLDEASIDYCLKLLNPKMSHLHEVERRKNFALALKELEANNESIEDWITDEYAAILRDHNKIFEEAARDSLQDSNIVSIYEDLLLYRGVLMGMNARGRLPALRELLFTNYSLENVKTFFKSTGNDADMKK
ncbi:unnamed protein product, partial [Mesorhabditis belari]|uniref:Bardet-Biedl syndrome 7 protein homolog n=1 Tax=Mesorhabditis belari TaxID=2138241 RepID=A0AAF3EAN7_9BILA